MQYEVKRICIGQVEKKLFNGKVTKTAYYKYPIELPTLLTTTGFVGDHQVYKAHGGVNKAVCLYDFNDYALWSDYMDIDTEFSLFGENITTVGLDKDTICIGDTFKLGEAVIQVTEGRGPCNTIAQVHNVPNIVKMMAASRATGCYFRVLIEGVVAPDSKLELVKKDDTGFTLHEFNELVYGDKHNKTLIEKALKVDALPEEHKEKFAKRL
ncbi:6-N-hydroxylaminopurine resistance protein [Macrococcoides canis]|uniref:6-N-hydroxylaminopurine resistance protein n=1 Tax=Macrococcoides canis TaxID=1855823 RepID=A0A1W7ACP6_9STAP|nr:MOSC domain-containing protein [Macrococcus canis]ARQ07375.1 6-N-hydroxylaminopurine resistance protein [Macrococcus canis]